jgi:hypothetical protein
MGWASGPSTSTTMQATSSTTGQQFSVNKETARLAALSPSDLQDSVVSAVSGVLGMSNGDVTSWINGGGNLQDLADQTDTSTNDLINAIKSTFSSTIQDRTVQTVAAQQIALNAGPLTADSLQLPVGIGGSHATRSLTLSLTNTASLLSIDPTALMQELSAGNSLTDLATTQGISRDDLLSAIQSDLPANLTNSADAAGLAGQIADATRSATTLPPVQQFSVNPDTARLAALSPSDLQNSVVSAVGDALGMSTDDVSSWINGGGNLQDLVNTTDHSTNDLINAIKSALPSSIQNARVQTVAAQQIADNAGPLTADSLQLPPGIGGSAATQNVDLSLTNTAALLGTTSTDLMQQLSQGSSLSDLATSWGVSRGDLLDAIQSDLPAGTSNVADPAALAGQIADSATSVTTVPPTQQFAVAAQSPGDLQNSIVSAVSDTLGMSTDDVTSWINGGGSLNDLAASSGTAHDDLITAIKTSLPSEVQGPAAQGAAAEKIAGNAGPLASDTLHLSSSRSLNVSLDNTAALLGTSTANLMQELSQGNSLRGLANAQGSSATDLTDAIQSDLPAKVPGWSDISALATQLAGDKTSTTSDANQSIQPANPPGTGSDTGQSGWGNRPGMGAGSHQASAEMFSRVARSYRF